MGARSAQRGQAAAEQEASQNQQIAELQAQQAPAAPAQDDQMAELTRLAQMHSAGILTDEEFTAAKAKALGI